MEPRISLLAAPLYLQRRYMKLSFLGQNRNETAGISFFVHNSEPTFSLKTFFFMFFHSCIFPFSALVGVFFPPINQMYVGILVFFTLIKCLLGNLESKLSSEHQKECNVSSYKFVPTVPVSISTQSPNNTDSDHPADIHLQFGLTAC